MKKEKKENQPVSFFFLQTLPDFFTKLKDDISSLYWKAIYNFHPEHRYHMINTRLQPGYYDIDKLMLHGNMALLMRYVEDERGGEVEFKQFIIELNDPQNEEDQTFLQEQKRYENEAYTIYKWWKYEYPKLVLEIDQLYLDPKKDHQDSFKKENELREKENEMLKRLIDIRAGLWT